MGGTSRTPWESDVSAETERGDGETPSPSKSERPTQSPKEISGSGMWYHESRKCLPLVLGGGTSDAVKNQVPVLRRVIPEPPRAFWGRIDWIRCRLYFSYLGLGKCSWHLSEGSVVAYNYQVWGLKCSVNFVKNSVRRQRSQTSDF